MPRPESQSPFCAQAKRPGKSVEERNFAQLAGLTAKSDLHMFRALSKDASAVFRESVAQLVEQLTFNQ
jgi:hypothetical protein